LKAGEKLATINELSVEIGVDLGDFTSSMQQVARDLQSLGQGIQPIDIGINTTHFETGIDMAESELADLSGETATPTVNADTAQAEAHMDSAQDQLNDINGETATADVNVNASQAESAISRIQDRLREIADTAKNVGENMSKYLSAPLAGVGIAAGLVASETEGATARIRNSLGLTADEADKLTGVAKTIYKNGFGESFDDVQTALIQTKQNIRSVADEDLSAITTQAMVLADTFDADVNEVTRAAYSLMENFGLTSKEAMDYLAHGAQNGLNFSNELFDNLSEYVPLFGKMGFSTDEYFKLLENGAAAGAYNLDYINDVMKEFQIRIKDGSKGTSDAMDMLSDSTNKVWDDFNKGKATVKDVHDAVITELEGMDDQVKANEIGVGLYGTKWEDLETDVMYYLGNVSGELEGLDGTMQGMVATQEQTFGQRFQGMLRELKAALEPLGQVLLTIGEQWLPKISAAVQTLSSWFNNLSPAGQQLVVVFGAIAAAIGPVLVVFGSIASAISALMPVFTAIATFVTGTLVPAFAAITAPVWGIIAAVAALIAIGVALYKNWDEISAKAKEIWGALKNWFSETWDDIKAKSSETWEAIKGTAAAIWGATKTAVLNIVTPMVDTVKKLFNSMKDGINTTMEGVKQFLNGVWETIKNTFLGALLIIVDALTGDFDGMKKHAIEVMENIRDGINNIWGGLKKIFSGSTEAVKGYVTTAWDIIKGKTTEIFNAVKSKISEKWDEVKTATSIATGALKTIAQTKFEEMKAAIAEKMNLAKGKIAEIWGEAQTFLKNIDLMEIGKNIISGLISGIGSMAGALWDKVKGLADGIKSKLEGALDIHSPSRVMRDEIGKWIPLGIAEGITRNLDAIRNAANQMAVVSQPSISGISSNRVSAPAQNTMSYGNVYVTIDAKNVQELNNVVDFFHRLPQAVRVR
jgi:TP901 family phage tail tape measure protein